MVAGELVTKAILAVEHYQAGWKRLNPLGQSLGTGTEFGLKNEGLTMAGCMLLW